MHFLDLKGELASQNDIVIELIPLRERCEFRSREFREGTEIQAIKYKTSEIRNPNKNRSCQDCDRRSCEVRIIHGKDRQIQREQKCETILCEEAQPIKFPTEQNRNSAGKN
jgi:hypothetical protein